MYDPDDISIPNGNYFAFPFTPEESALVLQSVPWDVTTSYRTGTAKGPEAILEASVQLDKYDFDHPGGWRKGIGTLEFDYSIRQTSRRLREEAEKVIIHLESGGGPDEEYAARKLERINEASRRLNDSVYAVTKEWLDAGKKVGLVGGDHSTPYGHIRAIAEKYGPIGILQIDAHADLRPAYEGFQYSHASIMHNVLADLPAVESLVQVAVRDLSEAEAARIASDARITAFSNHRLAGQRFDGVPWREQCRQIAEQLPRKVYVSFDIDGLTPEYAPSTGTPVPGGITFDEAVGLLAEVVRSGREIVGFDLCEVTPDPNNDWDANVGARVLYKLCNLSLLG
jgi:agmatinase